MISSRAELPQPVWILGTGRVGRALALWLHRRGVAVRAWNRRPSPLALEVQQAGVPLATGAMPREILNAGLIICAVGDAALAELAGALAALGPWPATVVLHLSGTHPAALLAPLLPGPALGSFHPVRAFTADLQAAPDGTPVGLEGHPRAVEAGQALAATLGMRTFLLQATHKPLYHAALALLSNGTVGLFASAERLLRACGLSADQSRDLLRPLLDGTAANLRTRTPAQALTGPVRRGDAALLEAHRAAVARALPSESALQAEAVAAQQRLLAEEEEAGHG
jgi:predicted short-subunit dehydrogenase-like oxidoreductase (DUF2520 family)